MMFTPKFLFIHSCYEFLFLQISVYTQKEIYLENNFLLAKYPHCLLFLFSLSFPFSVQYNITEWLAGHFEFCTDRILGWCHSFLTLNS